MLALWKESYNKPKQRIKKQRYHFADKGLYSQIYGFSCSHVQMWELDHKEAWVLKNWCFELWCWVRLLRDPWTARRSNWPTLKALDLEYSLEGLMLKQKLQYFGHLCEELTHLKRPWCWGRLKAAAERDDRGWDGWIASSTQWTWIWANSERQWRTRKPGVLQSMRVTKNRIQLSNWTTVVWPVIYLLSLSLLYSSHPEQQIHIINVLKYECISVK